jgi:hypothetical protein
MRIRSRADILRGVGVEFSIRPFDGQGVTNVPGKPARLYFVWIDFPDHESATAGAPFVVAERLNLSS